MLSHSPFEILPEHLPLWQHFQAIAARKKLSHAILLTGPLHAKLTNFAYQMAAAVLCLQPEKPCQQCRSCQLMAAVNHPDFFHITGEKAGSFIKIEQIRELQQSIFNTPKIAANRFILINPADKMNRTAANALLKILEEPPDNTHFVLQAEQISTILPTIISRCQLWRFTADLVNDDCYLTQGSYYPADSERGKVFADLDKLLNSLIYINDNQESATAVAQKWLSYDFNALIWLLYLINAQLIHRKLTQNCYTSAWNEKIIRLAESLPARKVFALLHQLNELIRNLNHNININPLLALEEFLLACKHN